MKEKLKLDQLKIKSFVTNLGDKGIQTNDKIKGGSTPGGTRCRVTRDGWFCDIVNFTNDCGGRSGIP